MVSLLSPGSIRDDVLGGKDNYLFLYDGSQRQFEFLTGGRNPTGQDSLNFLSNIRKRKVYCSSKSIQYLHVVFPSKPVIAKEMLPDNWKDSVNSLYRNHYGKVVGADLEDALLYPHDMLLERNAMNPMFRVMDTHMNDMGYLVTVQAVLKQLGRTFDSAENFEQTEKLLHGDLAKMLGSDYCMLETVMRPRLPILELDNRPYLSGNTNNVVFQYSPFSATKDRLLIFGDSFIRDCLKFFSPVFREVLYVRSAFFNRDVIELFSPDIIISSNAERYLARVQSDDESESVLMSLHAKRNYQPSDEFALAYQAQLSYAHHPTTYRRWIELAERRYYRFSEFGYCELNPQVEILDTTLRSFRSSGVDPFFTFPNLEFHSGLRYQIEVELESNVHSIGKIYFTEGAQPQAFSEALSCSSPVQPGRNRLIFAPKSKTLGARLRLDPLSCAGDFKIGAIAVSPLN